MRTTTPTRKRIVMLFHSFFVGFGESDDDDIPEWALSDAHEVTLATARLVWKKGHYDEDGSRCFGPVYSLVNDKDNEGALKMHQLIIAKAVDKYHTDMTTGTNAVADEVIAVSVCIYNEKTQDGGAKKQAGARIIAMDDPFMQVKNKDQGLWERVEEVDFMDKEIAITFD